MGNSENGKRFWAMRIAYGLVFCLNVMCALQFCFAPEQFAGAYQLTGVAGNVAVQGIGVAFLMWNCTYPLVIATPQRHKALAAVVLAQQAVGLLGETLILLSLPTSGFELLWGSILRFIVFDAAGLAVMAASFVACLRGFAK